MTTDPDPNPDQIDDRVERSDEAAYDFTARVLGRGTASQGGAYILPYLQSGHMLLLGVLLLASSISYPGDLHIHIHICMPAAEQSPSAVNLAACLWRAPALTPTCPSNGLAGFPPHASPRAYEP